MGNKIKAEHLKQILAKLEEEKEGNATLPEVYAPQQTLLRRTQENPHPLVDLA